MSPTDHNDLDCLALDHVACTLPISNMMIRSSLYFCGRFIVGWKLLLTASLRHETARDSANLISTVSEAELIREGVQCRMLCPCINWDVCQPAPVSTGSRPTLMSPRACSQHTWTTTVSPYTDRPTHHRHWGCCVTHRHWGCCVTCRHWGCCVTHRLWSCCVTHRYWGCCVTHRHWG